MYAVEVQGRELNFDVYGVWRKNLLMRDRETGTIWQHATGEALLGPLAGVSLVPLGGTVCTWSAWRSEYPQSTVAQDGPDYGLIPKQRLKKMLQISHVLDLQGVHLRDRRLDGHEEVVGLVLNGEAKAYPLAALRRLERIDDELSGVQFTVIYEPEHDRASATPRPPGKGEITVERLWWLGWSEFHPGSAIWDGGSGLGRNHHLSSRIKGD